MNWCQRCNSDQIVSVTYLPGEMDDLDLDDLNLPEDVTADNVYDIKFDICLSCDKVQIPEENR